MVCETCDAVIRADSKFCTSCGHPVGEPRTAEAAAPAVLAPPVVAAAAPANGDVELAASDFSSEFNDVRVLGSAAPNAHYLGQRLQYTQGAETFDASEHLHRATMAQLRIHLFLSIIIWLIGHLVAVLVVVLTDSAELAVLVSITVFVFATALLIAPFVRRQFFPLSEWKMLLDGKAASAPAVHDHIAAALVARRSPVEYRAVRFQRFGPSRDYLQIRRGDYSAFIACTQFGDDLYVGWTLWWSMSWLAWRHSDPNRGFMVMITLPWRIIVDAFRRDDESFEQAYVHQYDDAKALRECVHAVTRQGVEAAVGLVPLRGRGTIGSTVPSGSFARSPTFDPRR